MKGAGTGTATAGPSGNLPSPVREAGPLGGLSRRMPGVDVRKGMPPRKLVRADFEERFKSAEALRRLCDWVRDIHLVPAGAKAELDRYAGHFEPCASSHEALDRDTAFQQAVANATLTLVEAVTAARAGRLVEVGATLEDPRPK